MSYLVLFAIVWWKADIWWAIASVVAVNMIAPWHPSHYRADAAGEEKSRG